MYQVTIANGQRTDHRTCTGPELRNIVWETIRSEGGVITDDDHSDLIAMTGEARDIADIHGVADLQFGTATITITPIGSDHIAAD